jgi:hypothetical protein
MEALSLLFLMIGAGFIFATMMRMNESPAPKEPPVVIIQLQKYESVVEATENAVLLPDGRRVETRTVRKWN